MRNVMSRLISKYRSELMGIAIIMVMCYHLFTGMQLSLIPYISSIGYFGVDIFLFLSGFGLCFGFHKYHSVLQFYKVRFCRIWPTYIFVILLTTLFNDDSLVDCFIKSLGIGFFLPVCGMSSFDWYIPTLYLLYFAFPLCYMLINKRSPISGGGVLVLSMLPFLAKLSGLHIPVNNLVLSRFPIFIIGMIFASLSQRRVVANKIFICISCLIAGVGILVMPILVGYFSHAYLWDTMLYWLPFMLITPGLCYSISWLLEHFPTKGRYIFYCCGKLSLEIYLVHMSLIKPYTDFMAKHVGLSASLESYLSGLVFLAISVILAYLIHIFMRKALYVVNILCVKVARSNHFSE